MDFTSHPSIKNTGHIWPLRLLVLLVLVCEIGLIFSQPPVIPALHDLIIVFTGYRILFSYPAIIISFVTVLLTWAQPDKSRGFLWALVFMTVIQMLANFWYLLLMLLLLVALRMAKIPVSTENTSEVQIPRSVVSDAGISAARMHTRSLVLQTVSAIAGTVLVLPAIVDYTALYLMSRWQKSALRLLAISTIGTPIYLITLSISFVALSALGGANDPTHVLIWGWLAFLFIYLLPRFLAISWYSTSLNRLEQERTADTQQADSSEVLAQSTVGSDIVLQHHSAAKRAIGATVALILFSIGVGAGKQLLYSHNEEKPFRQAAPVISDISARPVGIGVDITWNTNVPTYGAGEYYFLEHPENLFHLFTSPIDENTTTHMVHIPVVQGSTLGFYVQSNDGYHNTKSNAMIITRDANGAVKLTNAAPESNP